MNPVLDDYLVPKEAFRFDQPMLSIGRCIRLSKKAFDALGSTPYVALIFDKDERTLSIRRFEPEEGQLLPPQREQNGSVLAYGEVAVSRAITGVKSLHDMLLKQLKDGFRFRLLGEMDGDCLEFRLNEAIMFKETA